MTPSSLHSDWHRPDFLLSTAPIPPNVPIFPLLPAFKINYLFPPISSSTLKLLTTFSLFHYQALLLNFTSPASPQFFLKRSQLQDPLLDTLERATCLTFVYFTPRDKHNRISDALGIYFGDLGGFLLRHSYTYPPWKTPNPLLPPSCKTTEAFSPEHISFSPLSSLTVESSEESKEHVLFLADPDKTFLRTVLSCDQFSPGLPGTGY